MLIELTTIVITPLVRALAGWGEKALADGKIDVPEWKRLIETVLRIGVPSLALFIGFGMPVEYAVAIPFLVDYGYHYINKILKKLRNK